MVARAARAPFLAGLAGGRRRHPDGLARYDTTLFSVHVVQHVLLGMVAPVLLALGAPVTLALQAAQPATRRHACAAPSARPGRRS